MWRNATERRLSDHGPTLALGLLVAAVFWPVFGYDFVRWDDPVAVTHNPLITEPWSADLLAKLINGEVALRFKPLPWLVYRGIHAAAGFNPAAWHAMNLALHLAATLIFFAVLRQMLARLQPSLPAAARTLLAWGGAALWAVHPAHVEPACWVTATPYPLLALCLLGSFWFYVRSLDGSRRPLVWAWCFAMLGYATYPVGVTYGLWLIAADIWIFRKAPGLRAFLLPAAVSMLVTWKSTPTTPWLYPAPPTFEEVDLLTRLKMGAAMLASVWSSLVRPFGHTPNNPMLMSWQTNGAMILSMAAVAVCGLLAVWIARHRRPGTAGVMLGSTALALPVLGWLQWPHWAVADRHVYLPHLVLTGGLVTLLASQRRFTSGKAAVGLLVLLVGASILGARQVRIWQDTDTLFRYVEKQPAFTWNPAQQAYIYRLWAAHAQEENRPEEAMQRNTQARRTLQDGALFAAGHGAWAEAVDLSRLLEQSFGLPPQLRRERARWLLNLGRFAEAGHELQRTLREMPTDQSTHELQAEWERRQAVPAAANRL